MTGTKQGTDASWSTKAMLPFSLKRELVFDNPQGHRPQVVIRRITGRLEKAKPLELKVHDERLSFRGSRPLFVTGLNLLVSITRGNVEARSEDGRLFVRYQLCFHDLVFGSGFLSLIFGLLIYSFLEWSMTQGVLGAAFAFASLWGFNTWGSAGAFRRMIRKCWKEIQADAS